MDVVAYFHKDGDGVEGLDISIEIYRVRGGVVLYESGVMQSVGDGIYYYNFSNYRDIDRYFIVCKDINKVSDNVIVYNDTGSEKVHGVYSIEYGRWRIDKDSKEMVFYDTDNETELVRFSLRDYSGNSSVDMVAERVRK